MGEPVWRALPLIVNDLKQEERYFHLQQEDIFVLYYSIRKKGIFS